ncbi:MAG: tRNA (cytidine(34)-2'-O)-methyltransferase [Pseudomonadota bacterium]
MLRLCAYQPDIAQNLGAMIRIGACFGVPVDVISPCGFPFSVKALRRSAMDYAEIAEVVHHDSWEAFRGARRAGRLVLMTTAADADLWSFRFAPGDVLVMGRESAGVPDDVHHACDARLRVPMLGGGRSLNVAVTAGIAVSEALRQLNGRSQRANLP